MSEKDVPVSVAQRIIIRFLVKDNVKSAEIYRKLLEQFGDECLSKTQVYEWCSAFRKGREVVANLPHARRPRTSVTDENVSAVEKLILVDFLTEQRTVNAQYYSNLLKNTVKPAYRSKRREIPIRSAILLQDNARPHTARLTMETLNELGWETLEHPPYSPDLSPCDYYLFGPLKEALGGLRFESNAEVESFVCEWLRDKPRDFYEKGIRKLPERWQKCVECDGDYLEKL